MIDPSPVPDSAFDSAIRAGTSQPIEEIEPIAPIEIEPIEGDSDPTEADSNTGDGDEIVTTGRGVGVPAGNTNALHHGRRAARYGLVLSKLRDSDKRAYRDLLAIRKFLEGQLKKAGKLDAQAMFRVQTVVRLEAGCRQMERELREVEMTALDRRTLMESLIRWTCQRDGIVSKLLTGVGDGSGFDWAAFDRQHR